MYYIQKEYYLVILLRKFSNYLYNGIVGGLDRFRRRFRNDSGENTSPNAEKEKGG